jgi:hypothetical protein
VCQEFWNRASLDARVQIDTNRYSVPWELAGQVVAAKGQDESLEAVTL